MYVELFGLATVELPESIRVPKEALEVDTQATRSVGDSCRDRQASFPT